MVVWVRAEVIMTADKTGCQRQTLADSLVNNHECPPPCGRQPHTLWGVLMDRLVHTAVTALHSHPVGSKKPRVIISALPQVVHSEQLTASKSEL